MSDSLQPHGLQHTRPPYFITNSRSLLKLTSTEPVMPSNHLILCCPLLLPPSIFPSIRIFSNESVLRIRWPKYWSFGFNISPSNEYSGLTVYISLSQKWSSLVLFVRSSQRILVWEVLDRINSLTYHKKHLRPLFKSLISGATLGILNHRLQGKRLMICSSNKYV